MDLNTVITLAGCVVRNTDGHILLIHRNTPQRVQWELPGGKVEGDEEVMQAAVRELREETGLQVTIVAELGNASFEQEDRAFHYVWFLAESANDTNPMALEDDHDDIGYFSFDELTTLLPLSTNLENLLAAIKRGEVVL